MENYICNEKIHNLEYYELHPNTNILVKDLKHCAWKIINEATNSNEYEVYKGNVGRKTNKKKWMQHYTYGINSPDTLGISLYNGCKIYNYSLFDKTANVSEKEMYVVADEIAKYGFALTGCGIIEKLIPKRIADQTQYLSPQEKKVYLTIKTALRGGANYTRLGKFKYETHLDYHQLYAYCMLNNSFPYGVPILKYGYYKHKFSIYTLECDVKLKSKGFPIITYEDKPLGTSSKWEHFFGGICDLDFELLKENYEIKNLNILQTLYYIKSFEGKECFEKCIHMLYNKRKESDGSLKRFYKLLNEYMAGYFERTSKPINWWHTLERAKFSSNRIDRNPKIGIWITAYGRQMLFKLLKYFNYKDIIGFDTDCVFFNGKKDEIPKQLYEIIGDEMGQVHFDGIYKNTEHFASKNYIGYDLETNEFFKKQAGVSKSGKIWYWDKINKRYQEIDIKENGNKLY